MIVAIVLAAGASKRMGNPKQNLRLGGVPMLQRVLDTLRASKVGSVVVVLGANADLVTENLEVKGEKVVVNGDFAEGMSASIRRGLDEAGDADAVLVMLGDQPFVTPATVDKIIDAYEESGALVVAPVCEGRRGNPELLDRALFPRDRRIRADDGAKTLMEENGEDVLEVAVSDRGVLFDIDTPSDYSAASRRIKRTAGRRGRV